MLSGHASDAIRHTVSQAPEGAVIVELGRPDADVTIAIAKSIKDHNKDIRFASISDVITTEFSSAFHNAGLDGYARLIAEDAEESAEKFGQESVYAVFVHSDIPSTMAKLFWSWSEKIEIGGFFFGDWTDQSKLSVIKETKGAYTRIGFDQSVWKIPLYTR